MFIDFRSVQFTIHFLKMGLTNVSLSSAEATVGFGNGSLNWTLGQNGTRPSNSPSFEQESLVSKVFKVLAYVIVIILSLVENSLTIGTVYQNVNRRMRTVRDRKSVV